MIKEEYFGTDEQRALLRRGRKLFDLLGHDTRYSDYGRTVGLVEPEAGDIDALAALVSVQGNSNYAAVPVDDVRETMVALQARGLSPLHYAKWEGGSDALSKAVTIVETLQIPDDLTLSVMDASTPDSHVAALAEMALGCGVLPICGEVLRGLLHPAVCVYAHDPAGRVVSCAAASRFTHPDHATLAGQAWWGMLATDPSRRGEGLALVLGAHALIEMETRFGIREFMTGVVPGNAPSEAVCTRMGFAPGRFGIVGCADPKALSGGRMTK